MRFFKKPRLNRTPFKGVARKNARVRESIGAHTQGLRRAARRNRVLVITLLAVGGLVALLTGLAVAHGEWYPQVLATGDLPSPRFGVATTYDGATEEAVLFGGFVGSTGTSTPGIGAVGAPPIVTNGQTWVYRELSGWKRRDSIHSPSPRGFAAMAYDGAHKNVVLFGGAPYRAPNAAVSGETWIWDGFQRDWTLVEPPEPRPDPRQNAVMVYDAHRRVVMMFGGRGADGKPMNDTWTWDGSAWTIMPRDGAPSPRHSAAIAYDECNAEAVMFGGIGDPVNNFTPQIRETWTWNGDGSKWTQRNPSLTPTPSRIGASMAYSYRSGRVLLYGGLTTTDTGQSTAAVDTAVWRWDGATDTWEKMVITDLSPINNIVLTIGGGDGRVRYGPPPRAYASFTNLGAGNFGGERGYFNLFGGTISPDSQTALGDHFIFSEPGISGNGSLDTDGPLSEGTPLRRKCVAPVPLPPDDAVGQIDLGAEARDKVRSREGVREIDQFPVLTGTDWPAVHRGTHVGHPSNRTPNPNYKPAPECPNRTTDGATSGNVETGENTHLFTDQKRNRVYQFFLCDPKRGPSAQSPDSSLPDVGKLLVESYHGTTLDPLGRVIIDINPDQAVDLAHDVEGGRFFQRNRYFNGSIVISELLVLGQDRIDKGADPIVKKIDVTGAPFFDLQSFFSHPKTGKPKVYFNVAAGGATAGPPPASSTPPKLGQWDIEAGREDWRVDLPGCATETASSFRTSFMRAGNRVYTTCALGNARYAAVRVTLEEDPANADLERVKRDGSGNPMVELFPGSSFAGKTWGDPKTERMFLATTVGGTTLWVFDGKVSRWVGRIGISSRSYGSSLHFNSEVARLYVQLPDSFVYSPGQPQYLEQGGLLMLDTGLTPVPQILKFPQFASIPSSSVTAAPSIASLPPGPGVPRRLLMRRVGGNMNKYPDGETVKMPNEMFYRVLADEVPVPEKPDISQLDALTIPVAEQPGKTEASFDAEGSGYGIRLRSVGGIRTIIRPPGGGSDQVEGLALGFIGFAAPVCIFPDRELMAGWVPQARLSDQDAGARSLGLDVDSNSKVDLKGPFSRCNPTANASNFPPSIKPVFDNLWPLWGLVQLQANNAAGSGTVETGKDADGNTDNLCSIVPRPECSDALEKSEDLGTLKLGEDKDENPTAKFDASTSLAWDRHFKEVECVGDSLATNTAAVGNVYGSANCVQRQGLVEATAQGSAPGVGPAASTASSAGFSVGEGYSKVVVTRDPADKGVVVTSTAVAKGIQIPGLTIARVTTKAVAWSNGRPSDPFENPRATFTREICGVVTPDYSNSKCLSTAEQKQLVDNWNARWGINSKMILPTYDSELFAGSPGGYIAGVIKPLADEVEDQFFALDYQKEVPGLVIEFYKDGLTQGPGRQVLQLAATRAVAGLGVQCNSELVYSSTANDCVALAFEDDPLEFEEEEEFFEDEDSEFELEGEWTPVEAAGDSGESLGARIGRLLDRLPILRRLPIRQMGEALLGASVWLLLLTPLGLATRRFALLNLARKV